MQQQDHDISELGIKSHSKSRMRKQAGESWRKGERSERGGGKREEREKKKKKKRRGKKRKKNNERGGEGGWRAAYMGWTDNKCGRGKQEGKGTTDTGVRRLGWHGQSADSWGFPSTRW